MVYIFKGSDPFSSHNKISRLIINSPNKIVSILDIGCNKGFIGHVLKNNGWKGYIAGLDKYGEFKKDVIRYGYDKFYKIDIEKDYELNEKFDVIVIGDVLEHLINPVNALRRLNKYLNNDGIFIISLPNIANFYIRLSLLFGRFEYMDKGILDYDHKFFYTEKSAKEMLNKAGLKIIKTKPTPIPLPVISKLFSIRNPLFFVHIISDGMLRIFPRFFGYQFIFLCK